MDYFDKIFWTILFGISGLIVPVMMKTTNNLLKRRLQKSNPQLVKNNGWFFSDTKQRIIRWVFWGMLTIWIILIWATDIIFFE